MDASQNLTIEVVSDFVCPWCYVGKRRLDKALSERPDLPVTVRWLPFQLSPDMPREGRNRLQHYQQIFGEQRAATIISTMRDTGLEEGIEFGDDPQSMSPNTLSAHTLMYWAQQDGGVDTHDLAERLFAAHHVRCDDIGDLQVLAEIAATVGLSGAEVSTRLQAGEGEAEVAAQVQEAVGRGVTGVPFFVINDRYGLSGAQPVEALIATLEQITAAA